MSTDEQQAALEALYEHEGLTDNLTDDRAKALLSWAETQIRAGRDPGAVQKAMRAANSDAFTSAAAVVQAATTALPAESQPATAEVAPVVVAPEAPALAEAAAEQTGAASAETTPAAAPEPAAAPAASAEPEAAPAPPSGPRPLSALERFVNQLAPNPLFRARKPLASGARSSQSARRPEQRQAPHGRTGADPAKGTGKGAARNDAGANAQTTKGNPQHNASEANEPKTESARRNKRRSKGKQRR